MKRIKRWMRIYRAVHLLSYLGGAVSMLAATFIVFSALSMGVTERQRSLAMLRAVGAVKSQIAGLVIFEGVLLSLIGVGIGVPLGYIVDQDSGVVAFRMFSPGVVVSWGGVALGMGGSLAAALAASLLPAWTATRVDPAGGDVAAFGPGNAQSSSWILRHHRVDPDQDGPVHAVGPFGIDSFASSERLTRFKLPARSGSFYAFCPRSCRP